MSELRRDALERDEKRLAELGRRTVEMYALAHIFTERLEVRGLLLPKCSLSAYVLLLCVLLFSQLGLRSQHHVPNTM
jgi:hypothetical protein